MKNLFLAIGLVIFHFGFSQTSRDVGEFRKVIVFDKITATLIPSEEEKVEISGDGYKNVVISNENGVLKIKMDVQNSLQGEDIKAKVYFKKLDEIVSNQGAFINSDKVIKEAALTINAKAGGKIKLKVNVEILRVKANAGGYTNIVGKATFQEILNNAGSKVEHKELYTRETQVTVNAGGSAYVNASDLVDAKTRAGGSIYIYGNPKEIKEKTFAGGRIKKITP